jgi:predicted extracellular nuclease
VQSYTIRSNYIFVFLTVLKLFTLKLNLLKRKKSYCFAFYNLENLFDIYDDQHKHDGDFTETSEKRWTLKRYKNKLKKISYAISQIGLKETKSHPAIIGLAEVENEQVLSDLIASEDLVDKHYKFVHYDSQDERGIDVAFLYDSLKFTVKSSQIYSIILKDDDGSPDYTRDILHVYGMFLNEKINVIINHWPSRRTGNEDTEHKRLIASKKVNAIVQEIKHKNENAKLVIMGDFNDDPSSKSIKTLVDSNQLYNPMDTLLSIDRGTTVHRGNWNLFDQIILSTNYFERKAKHLRFSEANIFDAEFLKQKEGDYKGTPYRTYVGKKYKGGYSDHFPVYCIFKR